MNNKKENIENNDNEILIDSFGFNNEEEFNDWFNNLPEKPKEK